MRTFRYNEPMEFLADGSIRGQLICTFTEERILHSYWNHWCKVMRLVGKDQLITPENCIEDWVTLNWAWEVKDA